MNARKQLEAQQSLDIFAAAKHYSSPHVLQIELEQAAVKRPHCELSKYQNHKQQIKMSATVKTAAQNISTTTNPWPYVALDPKQGLILFLITLPGTLANIVAFLTTLKVTREQRKVAPNYLILALNLTDFYGIVFCTLPTLLCYLHKRWVGGNAMCNFQSVSTMFASLASGILATAMAIDRLLAVWKPFLYKKHVTMRRTFFTVTGTWLGAFIVAISPLAGSDFFVKNLTGTYCTINWFAKQTANQVYAVIYAIIGVTLVAIVVFCNVKIVVTLLAQRKKRSALHGLEMEEHVDDGRKKSEMQLVKSVGAVSILFIICWFPFMVSLLTQFFGGGGGSNYLETGCYPKWCTQGKWGLYLLIFQRDWQATSESYIPNENFLVTPAGSDTTGLNEKAHSNIIEDTGKERSNLSDPFDKKPRN